MTPDKIQHGIDQRAMIVEVCREQHTRNEIAVVTGIDPQQAGKYCRKLVAEGWLKAIHGTRSRRHSTPYYYLTIREEKYTGRQVVIEGARTIRLTDSVQWGWNEPKRGIVNMQSSAALL